MAQPQPIASNESARPASSSPLPQDPPYPSNFYAWYCVFILFGIYINSFLDRQILALLVDVIKPDMGFSDTQMGFLGGPAFAIFYAMGGVPLGWLADRMSRRWLVGIGQAFWSLASVAFGLSQSFGQMIAARIGVGVGEATLSPSAYSLIADLFPPKRLAFALSVYGMGIYVGGGLANVVGGYVFGLLGISVGGATEAVTVTLPLVGEVKAWQAVFFAIALPTIPLTLLLLTFREPLRRGVRMARRADGTLAAASVPPTAVLRYMRANLGTVLMHNFGFACLSFSGYGAAFWNPALFGRIFGWEGDQIGYMLGSLGIFVGVPGILFGGWFADFMLARGYTDAKIRVGLITSLLSIPFAIAYPLMPDGMTAFVLLVPATFFGATYWGIAPAAIQEMMPNQMRGQASGFYLFVLNTIGLAFGPQILALLTDYVFQDEMKVHYSLVTVAIATHVVAGILLFLCLRRYRKSVEYLARWREQDQEPAA